MPSTPAVWSVTQRHPLIRRSAVLGNLVDHLPVEIQQLVNDPPTLADPTSWLPHVKNILPFAKYFIIILAFYIVWSTVAAVYGYFSRFLRFSMKIGPIIALLAWIMSASGQGNMNELMEAGKTWLGLSQGGQRTNWSPHIANLFGLNSNSGTKSRKSGGAGWFGSKSDPVSSRTRNRKSGGTKKSRSGDANPLGAAGDVLNSVINDDGYWGDIVQDYVKTAVAKAAGLEWLFGAKEEDGQGRTRGR